MVSSNDAGANHSLRILDAAAVRAAVERGLEYQFKREAAANMSRHCVINEILDSLLARIIPEESSIRNYEIVLRLGRDWDGETELSSARA